VRPYHQAVLTPSPPPAAGTPLVGRSEAVAEVSRLLEDARLVTLTGPPGVGKTRLALAVGAARVDAVWVDLAPLRQPGQVLAEVARALGSAPGARPEQLVVSADRDVLLVLDNCEHVIDGAAEVAGLLRRAPRLRVLATSRERLRLSLEREYAVPPLAMPWVSAADDVDLDSLRANPSVALLLARSPAGVRLTPGSARALAEICVSVDGLPLAIELAAARLRVFTPAELAFRMERRMSLLTEAPRDAPARHRSLRTAIGWSHDLLSAREQAVFRRLSVFPGDWDLDAAAAVCDDPRVLDAVESLLDKSLVSRAALDGEASARFTMLMSLREYAAEKLGDSGEQAATLDRHATWCAERAREYETTIGTTREWAALPGLVALRADHFQAFDTSREGDDAERTAWLAVALGWHGYTGGGLAGVEPVLDVLVRAREDDRLPADARSAAAMASGVIAYGLGDLDSCERAMQPLTGGDTPGRRRALATAFLGHVARGREQFDEAAVQYRAAAEEHAATGNARSIAWIDHDRALLALEQDGFDDAERLLRRAMAVFEEVDYEWALAECRRWLAATLVSRSATAEGAVIAGRALASYRRTGDGHGLAHCLEVLAEVALARGAAATAGRLAGAAEALREQVGAAVARPRTRRATATTAEVRTALGPDDAERQRRAGRTMRLDAALDLAERVVPAADAEVAEPVTLTARQREVAALVAAGHTNRQIGRDLGISEKTAEIHVHNVMARLGVPSRAGVAAWVAARDRLP
jgi:predicted ATPase/DNA-binding CsgD family transcriptional regulator